MQQIYSDNLTADDQKIARRIYLGLASCYAGLLLLLGVLVIFNVPDRGTHTLASSATPQGSGVFSTAMAADNPDRAQCAARDLKLLTSINEHGEAQDVPADDLRTAFFSLVRARGFCTAGRVDEALAIYDGVVIGSSSKTAQKQ